MKASGIIWLIEEQDQRRRIAPLLMANFPTRTIATTGRYAQFLSFSNQQLPTLTIINRKLDPECVEILKLVHNHKNIARMYLDTEHHEPVHDDIYIFDSLLDSQVISVVSSILIGHSLDVKKYKDLSFHAKNYELQTLEGVENIPVKEARILDLLLSRPGKCVSREELQKTVWHGAKVGSRTIDSHMSRLRKRLTSTEVEIESIYGGGYQLI